MEDFVFVRTAEKRGLLKPEASRQALVLTRNIPKMQKKKKKKTIEIGDHVKEIVSSKGSKKRCGEVLMILQDDPGDPTCELMEVNPDDLTPLEKGSDGVQMFKRIPLGDTPLGGSPLPLGRGCQSA